MAVTVHAYNNFVRDAFAGDVHLTTDVFKAILTNGYTFNASHVDLTNITGELPTGNGYTAGGQTISNITLNFVSPKTKWDCDDLIWSASGGDIGPYDGLVIYSYSSTTPTAKRLVLYADFGGSTSTPDGQDLLVTFGSDGIASFT